MFGKLAFVPAAPVFAPLVAPTAGGVGAGSPVLPLVAGALGAGAVVAGALSGLWDTFIGRFLGSGGAPSEDQVGIPSFDGSLWPVNIAPGGVGTLRYVYVIRNPTNFVTAQNTPGLPVVTPVPNYVDGNGNPGYAATISYPGVFAIGPIQNARVDLIRVEQSGGAVAGYPPAAAEPSGNLQQLSDLASRQALLQQLPSLFKPSPGFLPEVAPKPAEIPGEEDPPALPPAPSEPLPPNGPVDPSRRDRPLAPPVTIPLRGPGGPGGPGPIGVPAAPGTQEPPALKPAAPTAPVPVRPLLPQNVPGFQPQITGQRPTSSPQLPATPTPKGTTILPGGVALPDNGPRPTPQAMATELGKLERKLEIALAPEGPLSLLQQINRAIDQIENIRFVLDALFPEQPYEFSGGQYQLTPVCDRDSEGVLLPARVASWTGGQGEVVEVRRKIDALAQLIQHHKDLKQPTCGGRGNGPGSNVTVHFESD